MGPGAKIIVGGLNSWEMSTQHMHALYLCTPMGLSRG